MSFPAPRCTPANRMPGTTLAAFSAQMRQVDGKLGDAALGCLAARFVWQ